MLSFSGERTSWQLFRKQLRSSCDQNGMGWAITVGHAMNQFLIHIAASRGRAGAREHDRNIGRPPYLQVGYDQVQDNFFGNEFF